MCGILGACQCSVLIRHLAVENILRIIHDRGNQVKLDNYTNAVSEDSALKSVKKEHKNTLKKAKNEEAQLEFPRCHQP